MEYRMFYSFDPNEQDEELENEEFSESETAPFSCLNAQEEYSEGRIFGSDYSDY
jgi:hypothetical protein